MGLKSQGTAGSGRRGMHRAQALKLDVPVEKTFTEVVDHLTRSADEMFDFFNDHPALNSNQELRDLALELKDTCNSILRFCSTLRELVSYTDSLKRELRKTLRTMDTLWTNAGDTSHRGRGDRVALFREELNRLWPGGVPKAYVDEHTRVMDKVCSRPVIGCGAGACSCTGMCCRGEGGAVRHHEWPLHCSQCE